MKTGIKLSQVGSARPGSCSVLFISFLVLGASFLFFGILTVELCSLTTSVREYVFKTLAFLATGDNAFKFLAHLSGMFATIAFIGLLAVFASLLHLLMKSPSRYDKVLAALRFTLKRDNNAHVRSEAAKGLAKLDVEESALHQEHEELDDILVSTLQGEQRDRSPLVRSAVVGGLSELELEQHSYQHEPDRLDDMLFRENS